MDYTELEVEKILWHTLCEILGTPLACSKISRRNQTRPSTAQLWVPYCRPGSAEDCKDHNGSLFQIFEDLYSEWIFAPNLSVNACVRAPAVWPSLMSYPMQSQIRC